MRALRREKCSVAVLYNEDAGARADISDVANAARDVARALVADGQRAQLVAIDSNSPIASLTRAVERVVEARVDLVFNLCEAVAGQSAHEPLLPHLLELAGVPYTGSGPLALGLALRKDRARVLLAGAGVPIASGVALTRPPRRPLPLAFPLFVKLAGEDASVGIDRGSVVHDLRSLTRRVELLLSEYPGPVLVEEFIPGREIYVSLVGTPPVALPPHEIDFTDMPDGCPPIVTYDGKWDPTSAECIGSRPVRAKKLGQLGPMLAAIAKRAFTALGLSDYARVDFRIDEHGHPFVIDVNPNCDLSADAGMARAAGFAGWTHADLIGRICRSAIARRVPSGRGKRPKKVAAR